jgi:hypothetical protein
MKKINVQFTLEELQAILTLTDNQFFRMKFIDTKIPGYKARPGELENAKAAVEAIQAALKKAKGLPQAGSFAVVQKPGATNN